MIEPAGNCWKLKIPWTNDSGMRAGDKNFRAAIGSLRCFGSTASSKQKFTRSYRSPRFCRNREMRQYGKMNLSLHKQGNTASRINLAKELGWRV